MLLGGVRQWEAWLDACEDSGTPPEGIILTKPAPQHGKAAKQQQQQQEEQQQEEEQAAAAEAGGGGGGNAAAAVDEGAAVYEDFEPLLLRQHQHKPALHFPTFDAALEEFFGKVSWGVRGGVVLRPVGRQARSQAKYLNEEACCVAFTSLSHRRCPINQPLCRRLRGSASTSSRLPRRRRLWASWRPSAGTMRSGWAAWARRQRQQSSRWVAAWAWPAIQSEGGAGFGNLPAAPPGCVGRPYLPSTTLMPCPPPPRPSLPLQAALIEYNLEAVDAAINAVREAVASGMDWRDLGRMIKEERRAGNPVAGLIDSLQLELSRVTLLLRWGAAAGDLESCVGGR